MFEFSRTFALRYGSNTTSANGWMSGMGTDVGFPMPATLAFLARRLIDGHSDTFLAIGFELQLRDVQQFSQLFSIGLGFFQCQSGACERQFCFQGFPDVFGLSGLF